jgi:hypothetical protein
LADVSEADVSEADVGGRLAGGHFIADMQPAPVTVPKPHRYRAILDRGWIDHGKCAVRREELSDILIFFPPPELAVVSMA